MSALRWRYAVLVGSLVAAAACASPSGGGASGTSSTTGPGSPSVSTSSGTSPTSLTSPTSGPGASTSTPVGSPSTPAVDPALASLVELAVADLTSRLGVAPSAVTVVSAQAVTWPDGALGCPQPGMFYPQVLVEGALVVLDVSGTAYRYHSGGARAQFLCQTPTG